MNRFFRKTVITGVTFLFLVSILLTSCSPPPTPAPAVEIEPTAQPGETVEVPVQTGDTPSTAPEPVALIDPPTEVDMQMCETFAPKYGLTNCKFSPPVTITTFGVDQPQFQYKWGETLEDNVHTRWAKQTLGIERELVWVIKDTGEAFETKVRLALAAGEKMPDFIVLGPGPLMDDLIDSGQFMEVGPLFDAHASDMYKEIMDGSPGIWNPYIRDGKRMALPKPNNWVVFDPVMWVRQDWLKKLNLDVPTTLDELEVVMDAFVNQDPDGNGQKDTYGLVVSMKNGGSGRIADASWLFGAYGTIPLQWNLSSDGKSLVYGSIQPEAKMALERLKGWMAKGYVHPEAGVMGDWLGEEAAQTIAAGKVGIFFGPYWPGWNLIPDLNKNVPEAEMWPFQIPAGPDGRRARHGSDVNAGAILINKDCKNPEAIIYYNDYFYNILNPPPTGGAFEWGLHENYMWARDDNGNPTVEREFIPDGWVNAGDYALTGYPINPLSEYNANFNVRAGTIITPFDKIYSGWPKSQHEAQGILLESKELSWMNMYTGPNTENMKLYLDSLKTLELETYSNIIYGFIPLDEFDNFVNKWKSSGGDTITQEVNAWYMNLGLNK